MSEKTALLQEAFGFYDEDGTGTLSLDFLRDIAAYHGEGCPDVEEFIAEAELFADGSGNVDYSALAAHMTSEE